MGKKKNKGKAKLSSKDTVNGKFMIIIVSLYLSYIEKLDTFLPRRKSKEELINVGIMSE